MLKFFNFKLILTETQKQYNLKIGNWKLKIA